MQRVLAWIQGLAESLGGPGLFILAFLDSSFMSFPQVGDLLVVLLTIRHKERMIYYALLTTLGSVAGCYLLYRVGRRGGESFLQKRFQQRHIDQAMELFRRYGMLAILVPSLLPPPTPFKAFVLAAGVARVRAFDFVMAVAIGRSIRYFGQGLLAFWYGEQALAYLAEHAQTVGLWLGTAILGAGILFVMWKKHRRVA
jgi:membrane protein YqaA with SNARE-associated domain